MSMKIDEAIKFAEHAQTMTDIPEVKEFYAMAEKALRTQNQVNWISVKDRLPEEKVKVLVALGSNIRGKRVCIDQMVSGNWRGLGCLVTHWMPLPEPPKEGE